MCKMKNEGFFEWIFYSIVAVACLSLGMAIALL